MFHVRSCGAAGAQTAVLRRFCEDERVAHRVDLLVPLDAPRDASPIAALEPSMATKDQLIPSRTIVELARRFRADGDRVDLTTLPLLDNGFDETGKQVAYFSHYFSDLVVGLNIDSNGAFVESAMSEHFARQVVVRVQDKADLPFDDDVFGVVFSQNIMEHVLDYRRYIRESVRVLRPGGLAFFYWCPCWSGGSGHHLQTHHGQWYQTRNGAPATYRDDKSFVPAFAHLYMTEDEMRAQLRRVSFGPPAAIEDAVQWIYGGTHLSRVTFPKIEAEFYGVEDADVLLEYATGFGASMTSDAQARLRARGLRGRDVGPELGIVVLRKRDPRAPLALTPALHREVCMSVRLDNNATLDCAQLVAEKLFIGASPWPAQV